MYECFFAGNYTVMSGKATPVGRFFRQNQTDGSPVSWQNVARDVHPHTSAGISTGNYLSG